MCLQFKKEGKALVIFPTNKLILLQNLPFNNDFRRRGLDYRSHFLETSNKTEHTTLLCFCLRELAHKSEGGAALVCSACSAYSMNIVLIVFRQVIVNDMCDIVDVKSAGRHIGGAKDI